MRVSLSSVILAASSLLPVGCVEINEKQPETKSAPIVKDLKLAQEQPETKPDNKDTSRPHLIYVDDNNFFPTQEKAKDNPLPVTNNQLPKLFQPHDFNGNRVLDVPNEAIEFHLDRASSRATVINHRRDGAFNSQITKIDMVNLAKWFHDVANEKETSLKEREECLDVAARIHEYINRYMKDKKSSIPLPLPEMLAKADKNNDRKIDLEEACELYEKKTDSKLERDNKRQVTPSSFRKLIESFEERLHISNLYFSARWECLAITDMLEAEYTKLYGPYATATYVPRIIVRD